jgi:hypothetical protein
VNVEDAFGSKAEIGTLSFEQASYQQARCGEKNEADSNLSFQ